MKKILIVILLLILIILLNLKKEKFDNNTRINVITQFYVPKNIERQKEIKECLERNINNKYINKIYLFGEKNYNFKEILKKNYDKFLEKVVYKNIEKKLSYKYVFKFCNSLKKYNSIFVLTNSDIYFDETLKNLLNYNFNKKFLALSRINIKPNNKFEYVKDTHSSQDTWIWKNTINIKNNKKFKHYNNDGIIMGVNGCDNFIAYLLDYSGYKVENKCKLINTFHLHKNDFRPMRHNNNYKKDFRKNIKCID